MRRSPLTALDLVRVWEWGEERSPADRGLGLLSLALPDTAEDALKALTIGQRDAYLLKLRCATLGDALEIHTQCPQCEEDLEFEMTRAQLLVAEAEEVDRGPHGIEVDGYSVLFRLPDSRDLAAMASEPDPAAARAQLLRSCVLSVTTPEDTDGTLPAPVVEALAEAIGDADPQANIRFALRCAACRFQWVSVFDIVRYFWDEITGQVKLLTREVHALAEAYGWAEYDILAMSAARRRWYLHLLAE